MAEAYGKFGVVGPVRSRLNKGLDRAVYEGLTFRPAGSTRTGYWVAAMTNLAKIDPVRIAGRPASASCCALLDGNLLLIGP